MIKIGTPLTKVAKKALLCGSGELGKEVAIELQRYGVEVIALDRYENAPAMQVAHRSYVLSMLDGARLREIIEQEKPDIIIPEVEAIATPTLVELEKEGYHVIPTANATFLTMNRQGIRRYIRDLGQVSMRTAEIREAAFCNGEPCVVLKIVKKAEANTVQVVDLINDVKVRDITVGKEPNGMVVDKNGMLWVLCEGAIWSSSAENPTLWKIDPSTKQAVCMVSFSKADGAMNLAIDPTGNYLYYFLGGDVHRANVNAPNEEDPFVIPADGKLFYKIAVNPENGDIYVSDAKSYTVNGTVYRYSSDGVLLSSFDAGICPGFMLFN